MKAERNQEALDKIDRFFEKDAQMSEEDKLVEGLTLAVERNFMSQEEAEACFASYLEGLRSKST